MGPRAHRGVESGGTRFDLLGRDGRFIKAVQVPAGETIVGFGREVVYVARRDEDDLLRLKRYRCPDGRVDSPVYRVNAQNRYAVFPVSFHD